jgi:hypothetical protein
MRMVPSMMLGTVLWIGATSMVSVSAAAEAPKGQCKQEITQLCAGVERGPALRECVTKNFERLSPTCQERFRARQAKPVQKTSGSKGEAAQ